MKLFLLSIVSAIIFLNSTLFSQNNSTMNDPQNPLLCNPDSGICEIPTANTDFQALIKETSAQKPIKIVYYTDPICSSCWGIEPQLRKLKLEYGAALEIEYRMGGLLPDWNYNSGGISKPSDVAHHWDEVSEYYDMPIDGDVWLEDPLASSYPPSIAFKAAQLQDEQKAIFFLRAIRELVFLKKVNIEKIENILAAAQSVGLDTIQFKVDFEGKAKELFSEDLQYGKKLGVRGFPTLYFMDTTGIKEIVYGSKPYVAFEQAIAKMPCKVEKAVYNRNWEFLFSKYNSMTAKEFSELSGIDRKESEVFLNQLSSQGKLIKWTTKNGSIWTLM